MVMRTIAGAMLLAVVVAWIGGPAFAESSASHSPAKDSHAPAAEKAEGPGINPINFHGYNWKGDLAIWTAAVFLVVLLILWKFAWGPISDGLAKREHEIAAQIAEAQRSNDEARRLLEEHQRRLAASHDEVRAILDLARRDAERTGQEMIDKARDEASAERRRALEQIDTATAGALKELAERSATLAVELAGKIVRTQLKPQDHARLIQQAVSEFSSQGNGKN